MAALRFRPSVLLEARERSGLTQLQLAMLANRAFPRNPIDESKLKPEDEAARRLRTWESRIGAWERGVDSPSAPYIPTLASLVGVEPLELFEVDRAAPTFTALRMAAGMTTAAIAEVAGIPHTTLHRKLRGVTAFPAEAVERLAVALGTSPAEILAAIERDR